MRFILFYFFAVNFDHFQILRAIGKGSFGKVREKVGDLWGKEMEVIVLHSKDKYLIDCFDPGRTGTFF